MPYLHLVFLVLAFVLFLLRSAGIAHPRIELGWLGLAFLTLGEWLHP